MTPDEICGDIYLPLGIQLEARWWTHHVEQYHSFGVTHGVDVSRVKKAAVRDLVG
jgi:hypothetical protein